jgi:uncharacterized heparinase superfamily protein
MNVLRHHGKSEKRCAFVVHIFLPRVRRREDHADEPETSRVRSDSEFGNKRARPGRMSRGSTATQLLSKVRDISRMSSDEIRTRTMQGLNKRWDAAVYRLPRWMRAQQTVSASGTSGRFFFSAEELPARLQLIKDRLPGCVAAHIREAERVCHHRFDLLGYSELDYGGEIDWTLDAVHGKRAPRCAWYNVPFLEFASVGDAKITWELNRHQHLVSLAKACRFSGEERFLRELVAQWYLWHNANPYPLGINWASTLEVAFRSLSWLWVMHLVGDHPAAQKSFRRDLKNALFFNARYIERYLSTYFSPNTHLLGEGVALFFLGLLLPRDRQSERWQRRGWEIVLRGAERQVLSDGMHFERSTYYHVYALDFLLHARILAAANGVTIPLELDTALRKMLDALCLLTRGGGPSCFGDDDGGRVFDRGRNHREHMLDPLATGAALFGAGKYKSLVRELPEETLWLLGGTGLESFDRLEPQAQPLESAALTESGLYLLVSETPVVQQLTVNSGSVGTRGGGHSHADALSLQLSLNGECFLVDPGTFAYVSGGRERSAFRSTAAHNTLRVDNCEQGVEGGPFPWRSLPGVSVTQWVTGKEFDLVSARHSGYERLADPVVHARSVFFRKGHFCFVLDVLTGKAKHQLELAWHLYPRLRLEEQEHGLLLRGSSCTVGLITSAETGWSRALEEDWYSPVYGAREKSTVVRLRTSTRLPGDFATVLQFMPPKPAELGVLAQLHGSSPPSPVRAYRYLAEDHSCYLFFGQSASGWELGEFASDARFVYHETDFCGDKRLFLTGGSYLKLGTFFTLSCQQAMDRCEIVDGPEGLRVDATAEVTCRGRLVDFDQALDSSAKQQIPL